MKLLLLYVLLAICTYSLHLKKELNLPMRLLTVLLFFAGILYFNIYLTNTWINSSIIGPIMISSTPGKKPKKIRKSRSKNVQLIESYTKASNRFYTLTFKNTPLLESEALFVSVFKGMKKFFKVNKIKWNNKAILAQVIVNDTYL